MRVSGFPGVPVVPVMELAVRAVLTNKAGRPFVVDGNILECAPVRKGVWGVEFVAVDNNPETGADGRAARVRSG